MKMGLNDEGVRKLRLRLFALEKQHGAGKCLSVEQVRQAIDDLEAKLLRGADEWQAIKELRRKLHVEDWGN